MDNIANAAKQVHAVGGHFKLLCAWQGDTHGFTCECFFSPTNHYIQETMKEMKDDDPDIQIGSMQELFQQIAQHKPNPSKEELESAQLTHRIHIDTWDEDPEKCVSRTVDAFLAAVGASESAYVTSRDQVDSD